MHEAPFRDATIPILAVDPELGLRVPVAEIARARAELRARVINLAPGYWAAPRGAAEQGWLGFLMIEGVLARDTKIGATASSELIGEGDLIHPSASLRDDGLVPYEVSWHALTRVRAAVLDEQLGRSLAHWPQVMSALMERAIRRTHRMAIHTALLQLSPVETRLLVLFWHLAEQWGHVTPGGIALRLRLPHALLGQLVGCQRSSVTTALQHIYASGKLVRRGDGSWLLTSSPPDELAHVHWHSVAPAAS